jgi:hypothetical protein
MKKIILFLLFLTAFFMSLSVCECAWVLVWCEVFDSKELLSRPKATFFGLVPLNIATKR